MALAWLLELCRWEQLLWEEGRVECISYLHTPSTLLQIGPFIQNDIAWLCEREWLCQPLLYHGTAFAICHGLSCRDMSHVRPRYYHGIPCLPGMLLLRAFSGAFHVHVE